MQGHFFCLFNATPIKYIWVTNHSDFNEMDFYYPLLFPIL
jgi:hypothetical protein